MKTISCLVVVVGIVVVTLQGSHGAVLHNEGSKDLIGMMDQNSTEILAELINFLISNGTDSNEHEVETGGRKGRALGPGIWCSLPQSLVDAFNPRTARVLGMSLCTPPLWKQQKQQQKKTTTVATTTPAIPPLCLDTPSMDGSCITEAPFPKA